MLIVWATIGFLRRTLLHVVSSAMFTAQKYVVLAFGKRGFRQRKVSKIVSWLRLSWCSEVARAWTSDEESWFESREGREICLSQNLQTCSGTHPASHSTCNGGGGAVFAFSLKVAEVWSWQLISASATVKSERSYASTPHIPVLRAQGQIYI